MATKSLPSQVRGQRISREELIREAREELDTSGVNHFLRAEYLSELATVVVGNDAPILCQKQPKVRRIPDKYWDAAHRLVAEFLIENGLTLTHKTATVEFPSFPNGHISASSSSAQFQDLTQARDDEAFADRVNRQASAPNVAAEPPPPPPEKTEVSPKKSPAGRGKKKAAPAPAEGEKAGKPQTARRAKPKVPPAKGKSDGKGSSLKPSPSRGDDDSASLPEGE
jgi:hypothetical protein